MPVIATNTAANTAVRYLNANSRDQSDSLAKLSSGSRITKASDDAAGLAISTRISSDVATLEQASTNASHGISILQVADGGASRISDILERMKTLASESSSGTVTDDERTYIQSEFSELQDEIDGIASSTRYNGSSLLSNTSTNASMTSTSALSDLDLTAATTDTTLSVNGKSVTLAKGSTYTADDIAKKINDTTDIGVKATVDSSGKLSLTSTGDEGASDTITLDAATKTALGMSSTTATGTDATDSSEINWSKGVSVMVGSTASDTITLSVDELSADKLGVADLDISTQDGASSALDALDDAISTVSGARAEIGAVMSRFEFRQESIETTSENLDAAASAISDVDIASEQAKLSAETVKVQAAVAAASQANQMPQNLLKLLQ
jgi:flagellin